MVELVTTWARVEVPQVKLGTHAMSWSESPDHMADVYRQFASGEFVGYGFGNWEPPNYTYYGDYLDLSCSEQPDGTLMLVQQWWWHDEVWHPPGQAVIICQYDWVQNGSPPETVRRVNFLSSLYYPVSELRVGVFPGVCPSTVEEAYAGIAWMDEPIIQVDSVGYACIDRCGAFSCSPDPTWDMIVPSIDVGTHELRRTSREDWHTDFYKQYPDGRFMGYGSGEWDPPDYTSYGEVLKASCDMLSNDKLEVMTQYWTTDSYFSAGEAKIICLYQVWKREDGSAP